MKKLVCILLAVGMLFSLAACSGEEKTENSTLSTLTLTKTFGENEDQQVSVSLEYTDELTLGKEIGDGNAALLLPNLDKTAITTSLCADDLYDVFTEGEEKITFCGYDGYMSSTGGGIYLKLEEKEDVTVYLSFIIQSLNEDVAEKLDKEHSVETYLNGIEKIQYQGISNNN